LLGQQGKRALFFSLSNMRLWALLVIWGSYCSLAYGNGDVTRTAIKDASPGTAGLGFGLRYGQSPYKGVDGVSSIKNDNQYDLVPLYLYEGKYLFMHGTSAGVHVYRDDVFNVDLLARYRFDRLEADASDFLEGMEDRDQTVDGGLRFGLRGDWGSFEAEWVTDMLDYHNGEEFDFTYRYDFLWDKWQISPYFSYVRQDEDLADYYYGVNPDEATAERPEYHPGAREFYRAGVNSSYHLTSRWSINANLGFDGLGDSAKDSPIVDKQQVPSFFLSATYMFGDVFAAQVKGAEQQKKRGDEWSWRLNYGYTGEETFHKQHRGELKKSEDVSTNLAGLTVGKLLSAGNRIDYYGKFSLNRRLEKDYQDDFWEYVAYIMAMGKGYAPWSEKLAFRYGFGFGFSYADQVPIIEQVKQEKRDRDPGHFLNYLEAQVDFPVTNFFDIKSAKNCFVGMTLVHRSGIFATSDILGNVSGGSDVVTAHLECLR